MCKHCFDKEHFGLTDLNTFFSLETNIQKKLASKSLKLLKKDTNVSMPHIEESLYQCNFCNETWVLSLQEYLKRSYFIKEKHLIKYKNDLLLKEKRHNISFFGTLIIIVILLISWVALT